MSADCPAGPGLRAGFRLLTDLRAEITRADAKATVLAGVLGLTVGPAALPAGRHRAPGTLPLPAALLWWAGVAALLTAVLALLLAVVPRYRRSRWEPGRPLTYFGDVRRAARAGDLAAALEETGGDPLGALLLALGEASRIAARKHLWVRVGLTAFAGAAVLVPAALLAA
ncbi:Pycsar system effector family protein [Streptomyces similanensis]|uniref:Pycsar effector protein domain-containing protein n=1 Tax=Streptomyces similanensis TaxID=1274988 RepID=A0ABP9KZ29_9ACTN